MNHEGLQQPRTVIHDDNEQKQQKEWKEILSSEHDEAKVKHVFNQDGVIEIYIDQQDKGSNSNDTSISSERVSHHHSLYL